MPDRTTYYPLVSVGIPTFNRPSGLKNTLENITNQTYRNLEIIVSDNCSTDPNVLRVINEYTKKDSRIRCYSQSTNIGPLDNFKFVLENSTGDYFFWAADDDKWTPDFVETCINELNLSQDLIAVVTEAQYFSDEGNFEFFKEGEAFYSIKQDDSASRIKYMIENNYGNLIYSIFRRDSLFENGVNLYDCLNIKYLNEIPQLLFLSNKGQFRVLPSVKFFKKTVKSTYLQAKWEKSILGLPPPNVEEAFKSIESFFNYHILAINDVINCVDKLDLSTSQKIDVSDFVSSKIWKHFLKFVPFSPDFMSNNEFLSVSRMYSDQILQQSDRHNHAIIRSSYLDRLALLFRKLKSKN